MSRVSGQRAVAAGGLGAPSGGGGVEARGEVTQEEENRLLTCCHGDQTGGDQAISGLSCHSDQK